MSIDELNKACPDHDRSSCSDASPINAGIDYRSGTTWCRRCEGLHNIRTDARITELEAVITVRDAEIARLNADLELARVTERERICTAIKATDDAASACDYMLDSNDCIAVVRGELGPANYECAAIDAARGGS